MVTSGGARPQRLRTRALKPMSQSNASADQQQEAATSAQAAAWPVDGAECDRQSRLTPAAKERLLQQVAEQNKQTEVVGMLTKAWILAALLLLALWELWVTVYGVGAALCEQPLHAWLLCDGLATFAGVLLSLTSVLKSMQAVRRLEARHWLLADDEQRDNSGDLTGAFRIVRVLSDGADVVLIVLFACGWYWFYQSGAGDEPSRRCEAALRSFVWWALVLKPIAPIGMSLVVKGWLMLRSEAPAVPGQAVTASRQITTSRTPADVSQKRQKRGKKTM